MMFSSRLKLVVAAACIISIALISGVWADDTRGPSWRGDPGTTYQSWDFLTQTQSPAPEGLYNPYGTPTASVAYADWMPSLDSHTGVLGFNQGAQMCFGIPNSSAACSDKLIWVQLTYKAAGTISAPPMLATTPGFSSMSWSVTALSDGWKQGLWQVTLLENQGCENVVLSVMQPISVDQVVIDTYCPTATVPEPGALVLAAPALLGLLGLRRRRA